MFASSFVRRAGQLAALFLSLSLSVACSDSDPLDPDPEPNVYSMEVEVTGGGSITFNRQKVASGMLTFGDEAIIAVTFRGPDGAEDAIASNPDNFELRVNYPDDNPAGLQFTPSTINPFAGTFTRVTPTTTPMIVQFELYHLTEDHSDGRWNAQVNVT